jgi:hypothetical protein
MLRSTFPLGKTVFKDYSTAGTAHIDNFLLGETIFKDKWSAANADVHNFLLGQTVFKDKSSAGYADIDSAGPGVCSEFWVLPLDVWRRVLVAPEGA